MAAERILALYGQGAHQGFPALVRVLDGDSLSLRQCCNPLGFASVDAATAALDRLSGCRRDDAPRILDEGVLATWTREID